MKATEKRQAITLRSQGKSIKEISKELSVAKSSVSLWVRNIELTDAQKDYLKRKGLFKEKVERTRKTRLANEKYKRDLVIDAARKTVPIMGDRHLWLIGMMLYWGEGGKTRRAVSFSNSDPDVIRIMMRFFRETCNVPEKKFRGRLHIHEHLDYRAAEMYWLKMTGIDQSKLYKTYRKQSKASKGKKDSLPYGTFDLYVMDTHLFYEIVGWARGISENLLDGDISGFGAENRSY